MVSLSSLASVHCCCMSQQLGTLNFLGILSFPVPHDQFLPLCNQGVSVNIHFLYSGTVNGGPPATAVEKQAGEESLATLRTKVAEAVQEAEGPLKALLTQAWLLGPNSVGPNILLASQTAKGLFDVPENAIVSLLKRPSKLKQPFISTTYLQQHKQVFLSKFKMTDKLFGRHLTVDFGLLLSNFKLTDNLFCRHLTVILDFDGVFLTKFHL